MNIHISKESTEKITSEKDLKKCIVQCEWKVEVLRKKFLDILSVDPSFIMRFEKVKSYLTQQQRQAAIDQVFIEYSTADWLPYIAIIRDMVPDIVLREKIEEFYTASPWIVQVSKEKIKDIFPNEYFKHDIIKHNGTFGSSAKRELFLLFSGHHDFRSLDPIIQQAFIEEIENAPMINATLYWTKDPGFACGWMEKNYYHSLEKNNGNWLCIVNNVFIAKYYHRKWEASKVCYVPIETCKTENWFIIWENYFYAPSDKQHEEVIDAINNNIESIFINNLSIKAVRPVNQKVLQSKNLYKKFLTNK